MERETRFELATPTLARLCSTTELFPHSFVDWKYSKKKSACKEFLKFLRFFFKLKGFQGSAEV
jgi:hypothetical protein